MRAVMHDFQSDADREEGFEISPRFRRTLEERLSRLESDADGDEAQIRHLQSGDHIRRQRRLVAAERAEALRLRIFLDRARTRPLPEQWTASKDR